MENQVKSNIKIRDLMIIFFILVLGLIIIEFAKQKEPTSYHSTQLKASEIMLKSMDVLREEREKRGIPINEQLDPNRTGLIGEEYTKLTTTLGNLSAKRSSTNPDFAALIVRYFKQAELEAGDLIAIGASGSFPGLIIATLSACQAIGINPLIIYSIGASEYGATIPDFTFIEMLASLNQRGVMDYSLIAVSMGGDNDQSEGMLYPDSKEIIRNIANRSGVTFIDIDSLSDNVQKRMAMYQDAAGELPIKLFVNIGGASPNYGNTLESITYPNGLIMDGPVIPDDPERGLIFEYQVLDIPVIHLLNIRDLALENGIPIDPIPFPEIGQSMIYFEWRYHKWMIVLLMLISSFFLVSARRNSLRSC